MFAKEIMRGSIISEEDGNTKVQFLFHDGDKVTHFFRIRDNVEQLFERLQTNWPSHCKSHNEIYSPENDDVIFRASNHVMLTYEDHEYMVLINGPCIRHLTRKNNSLTVALCRNNNVALNMGGNVEENYQALRRQMDAVL